MPKFPLKHSDILTFHITYPWEMQEMQDSMWQQQPWIFHLQWIVLLLKELSESRHLAIEEVDTYLTFKFYFAKFQREKDSVLTDETNRGASGEMYRLPNR